MGVPWTGLQRQLAAAGVLIAALPAAPSAQASSAPEVFLREADASNQPMGGWIPTGDSSHGCTAGPSTTGSFTGSAPTTLRLLGHMVTSNPIRAPFGGLEVFPAVGSGGTKIRCARDPRPAADGTLTGSLVVNQAGDGYVEPHWTISAAALFEQPGSYACVGRSVGGGDVPGPWSAPTATADVQTGFYPQPTRATKLLG